MNAVARGHKPDYMLIVLSAILLAVGLVVVYSVSPGMSALSGVSEGYYVLKQIIAIAIGTVAFIALSKFPYKLLGKLVLPLAIISLISVLAVQVFGEEINGAHRWIQIGGISFQPVELVKFTLLIWMADLLSQRMREGKVNDLNSTIKLVTMAILGIGVFIGVLQSDFGSTVVMVSMILAMLLIAGISFSLIVKVGLALIIGAIILIAPSEYRRGRVATFMNPAADCQNSGYQSCQALIAVGSGGVFGLGLARSVQAYGYLPEAANDSIFAIIAEKFGFVGVSLILAVYIMLFVRLNKIAERAPDNFSKLIIIGIIAWLSVQSIINVGAMLGLLPLKGITLPFISYGGTSLLFVMGALGLVFQISRYSSLSNVRMSNNDNNAYRRGQRRPYYATASRR